MFKKYVEKEPRILNLVKITKEMIENLTKLPTELQPYTIHPQDQTDGNINEYIKKGVCGIEHPISCLIIDSVPSDPPQERQFVREGDYICLTKNQIYVMCGFTIERNYKELPNEIT